MATSFMGCKYKMLLTNTRPNVFDQKKTLAQIRYFQFLGPVFVQTSVTRSGELL